VQPGDLATSAPGLASTNYKLNVTINDVNPVYGEMNGLASATRFTRHRFYFDPNTLTMADNDRFQLLNLRNGSGSAVGRIEFGYTIANGYNIRAGLYTDAGAWVDGTAQDVSDAPHCIEYLLARASTSTAADGRCHLRIDGILVDSITDEDNYNRFDQINKARLGAPFDIDAGTSAHFTWTNGSPTTTATSSARPLIRQGPIRPIVTCWPPTPMGRGKPRVRP